MEWSKELISQRLGILADVSERKLKRIKMERKNAANYCSLHDEIKAKLNLFTYLQKDGIYNSRSEFLDLLDQLEKNPVEVKEKVYDHENYLKYWNSYLSLLKISDFEEF